MIGRARRLVAELRRAPPAAEVERAVAAAPLRVEGDVVHVDEGVYPSIPTRGGRVALLARARALGGGRVVLHANVGEAGSHPARVVVDGPRRLLRALHVPRVADPGDRFPDGRLVHLFFDEEPLRAEIADAGLRVAAHHAGAWTLVPGRDEDERPDAFAIELRRAAGLARAAERSRHAPPDAAVRAMRERGARQAERGPIGRARLRRAIGWVDALMPGGPNCYRRTLLELGLDAGAARETLVFGLDVDRTGHVAFKGREEEAMQRFDVVYELGPD